MVYFLFFVCLVILQDFIVRHYIKNALKNVNIRRYFSKDRVYEGDEFEVIYVIENAKWLPLINLKVVDMLPESVKVKAEGKYYNLNSFRINVMGFRRVTRIYSVKAMERDYVSSSLIKLSITDMLGVRGTEKTVSSYDVIYVYPRPKKLLSHKLKDMIEEAKPWKTWLEEPLMFYSIREYMENDLFKRINWKKTAQLNKLMVNEFETNKNKRVILLLDIKTSKYLMTVDEMKLVEDIFRYTAYLTAYLIKAGYEVGVYGNCGYKNSREALFKIQPGIGNKHLLTIYDGLSLANYNNVVDFKNMIQIGKKGLRSNKIIMLALYNEQAQRDLKLLRNHEIDASMIGVVNDEQTVFI